jgi:hypothetical protein
MSNTVKIENVTYNVISSLTAEEMESTNCPAVAEVMRQEKCTRHIVAMRPRGKKEYFIKEYMTAYGMKYTTPFSIR